MIISSSIKGAATVNDGFSVVGAGGISSNFDEYFIFNGSGDAEITITSSKPFDHINVVASGDYVVETNSDMIQLLNGVGVIAVDSTTSTTIKLVGMQSGDLVYISRPARVLNIPNDAQGGQVIPRYTSSYKVYSGAKSVYPANHIHHKTPLGVNVSLQDVTRANAELLSDILDDAHGACIIEGIYLFDLDWQPVAHSQTRLLVNFPITGKAFKAYD